MMQSLLLACLMAAPALAHSSLRGAATRDLQASYQIDPIMLDENQIAYFVSFKMQMDPEAPSNPSPRDLDDFNRIATEWVTKEVMRPVLQTGSQRTSGAPFAPEEFNLYLFYGQGGCVPGDVVYSQSYDEDDSVGDTILITMMFACQFEGVDRPKDSVNFIAELKNRGMETTTILETSLQESGAPLMSRVVSMQTTGLNNNSPSWQPIGNRARNDNFKNGYVLPFDITWSFTTLPAFATQADYGAMEEATTDWLERNWDSFYSAAYPGSENFARRTVDVTLQYSSFSPTDSLYTQSLTLGVEILVGADNITDVPSVTRYTTSMQLYYPLSNFTDTLDGLLEEDSIFLNNTHQTSYAISPTFPVAELSESKNQTEVKDSIDVVNYATVSVSISPNK